MRKSRYINCKYLDAGMDGMLCSKSLCTTCKEFSGETCNEFVPEYELKPCPFCGSTSLKIDSKHNGHWSNTGTHSATVRCNKCHSRGPTSSSKVGKSGTSTRWSPSENAIQLAVEKWNTRQWYEDCD